MLGVHSFSRWNEWVRLVNFMDQIRFFRGPRARQFQGRIKTGAYATLLCAGLLTVSILESTPHLEHLSDVDCYSCVVRHDGAERSESMALSVRHILILHTVPLPAVRATSSGDVLLNFARPPPA